MNLICTNAKRCKQIVTDAHLGTDCAARALKSLNEGLLANGKIMPAKNTPFVTLAAI